MSIKPDAANRVPPCWVATRPVRDPSGDDRPVLDKGHAFLARGDQAVNYSKDVWHHGFVALGEAGAFLMLRWEDGTSSDEEFLSLPDPIRIEG